MSLLSEQSAKDEFGRSKMQLEAIVRRPVELFAFPYGNYNESLSDLAKDFGYQRVFTIEPALAFSRPDEFVTGSCSVSPTDWNLEFRLKLLGAYHWLPPVYRFKRKAILTMGKWTSRTKQKQPVMSGDA
jgi:peptidoglycan/xylan/chitin deacetylase (PgdA/CDA1 family)